MSFLLGLALLGAVGQPAPGANAGPRWFGIGFGTAAVMYRQRLGDPLTVTRFPEAPVARGLPADSDRPPERKARFWVAGTAAAYLIVTERNGAVTGIEVVSEAPLTRPLLAVEADPSGVVLGTTIDEVIQKHPAARRVKRQDGSTVLVDEVDPARGLIAAYRFTGDRLVMDDWFTRSSNDGPQLPGATPYAEPAGDSELTAILDVQSNELDGIRWERLYLQSHPCDGKNAWSKTSQGLRVVRDRRYDVISATCASTGAKRDFFFDTTSFFGRSSG